MVLNHCADLLKALVYVLSISSYGCVQCETLKQAGRKEVRAANRLRDCERAGGNGSILGCWYGIALPHAWHMYMCVYAHSCAKV